MKKRVSTSHVFRDVRFDVEDAANLKLRALLMIEIAKYIQETHLTKKSAAARLGVTQPPGQRPHTWDNRAI
jgi:predicted XRE-type DNA-binding protein